MRYLVDIGNTHYKIYNGKSITKVKDISPKELLDATEIYTHSVNKNKLELFLLNSNNKNIQLIKKECILEYSKITIPKDYKTLGTDRILDMQGAFSLGFTNFLVIDLGTAITYNLVKESNFLGGAISPSFNSRIEILHKNGELPKIDFTIKPHNQFALNTENSIKSGVYYGIISEIENFIKNSDCKNIIFTGGGCKLILDYISSNNYNYYEELLFLGLSSIINKENR